MNRHLRSGSRANRDRRDQAYARALIAAATRRHNTAILLRAGEIEVCPDCFGTGEVVRHVSDETVTEAICLECSGRGWVK